METASPKPAKISILSKRGSAALLKRLQLMGFSARRESPRGNQIIDRHETDRVYLVSFDLMEAEEWADLRVSLAPSGLYYVVFGDQLGSREIMEAARDGAHDVVIQSDSDKRWKEAIYNAANAQLLWRQLYGGVEPADGSLLVGRSGAMKTLRESVRRLGPTDASVLVLGESGTGKERVAEALHQSAGKGGFVAVNCAAIPKDLMESELFGSQKGAFTGAVRDKPGLVEEAAGGTLFLDEIGELDHALQPKLLRFLETRQARRVGSTKEYRCDVRVVSATNRDLEAAVDTGTFRADLYYRLSEVILKIPPLRHHLEDVPELSALFIQVSAERHGKNFEQLEPGLIFKFQQYGWPGNVRELKQSIDRIAILHDGPVMREGWWDLPERAKGRERGQNNAMESPSPWPLPAASTRSRFAGKRERLTLARQLLKEEDCELTWVAAQLGIHPTTLYRWRKAGKV